MKNLFNFDEYLVEAEVAKTAARTSNDPVWKKLRDTLMTMVPKPRLLTFTSEGVPTQSLNWGSMAGPGKKWGFGVSSYRDNLSLIFSDESGLRRDGMKMVEFFRERGYPIDESLLKITQPKSGSIDSVVSFDPKNPEKLKMDLTELVKTFPLS